MVCCHKHNKCCGPDCRCIGCDKDRGSDTDDELEMEDLEMQSDEDTEDSEDKTGAQVTEEDNIMS